MTDTAQRSARIRSLPMLFMVWAVLFALYAICAPFVSNHDLATGAKENELQTVSGSVVSAPYWTCCRREEINIEVLGSDGLHHLTQKNMGAMFPEIMNAMMALRAGDEVTARVKHDPFGEDHEWVSEMQRNGITILNFQDTRIFYEYLKVRQRLIGRWAAGLALVFLLAAILLRRKFGAWGNTQALTPQENQRQAY